jgi:hypothetical protein
MIISRIRFYGLLVLLLAGLCGLYQTVWLFSRVTDGKVLGFGHGSGRRYRSIQSATITYNVGWQQYTQEYLRNGLSDTTASLEIRYLLFWPSVSRENTWIGNWGGPLLFFIITSVITTIVFLQSGVIPFGARFQLEKKLPFVRMVGGERSSPE